jgi:hypothetical protein
MVSVATMLELGDSCEFWMCAYVLSCSHLQILHVFMFIICLMFNDMMRLISKEMQGVKCESTKLVFFCINLPSSVE